jgi:enoyl-CoA hydratase
VAPEEPSLTAPDFGTRFVVAEVRGRVLHLRIDRVERRNAFTQDMYRALKRAAVWADGQAELDAVCLTGTHRWFGAGGDMGGRAEDTEGLATEWDSTEHFPFRHIERCRKLWVAKVNGLCHAGGLDLTLCCDIAVASDQARFRVPELLRGIPDPFMSARLAEAVGLARARYLFFTAAEITAHEAEAMGLVGKVVPHDQLDDHVDWVLEQVALTGPQARADVKRDLNGRLPSMDYGLFFRAIERPEMREGMDSFLQKRPPEWPR